MTNCVFEEPHYVQCDAGDFSLCHDKCSGCLPSLLAFTLYWLHSTGSKFASGTWITMNGH